MKIDEKHKQMNRTKSVDLSQSLGRADMEEMGGRQQVAMVIIAHRAETSSAYIFACV